MKKILSILVMSFSLLMFTNVNGQLMITELTDPQNSSDAGRYVEIFNSGSEDIDLSAGYAIQRWTNGNTDPQSAVALTGTIAAGGFYIVCNDGDKFSTTFDMDCSQDIGTSGAADSNGDDNIALIGLDGSIIDMFGVVGEDGSGTRSLSIVERRNKRATANGA